MAGEEFNLSILENATAFSTPLKECSDYEAILSLIKEEIDIVQTEDEMECQKRSKKSPRGAKRKESEFRSSETVFKSPYKKKYSLKMLSPGAQPMAMKKKSVQAPTNCGRENRARSLGRAKPGRSCSASHRRRSLNSHSESSNFSHSEDSLKVETPKKMLLNGFKVETVERNSLNSEKVITGTEANDIDSANVDNENIKGESTFPTTADHLDIGAANESFVESSQTMSASSELRIELNRRRSAVEITPTKTETISENEMKASANDEDENENFSLVLSPVRQKRRKISGSPLNGLSQELENCIRNGDYVEMCDSETESMSFTFETIQLLNEYEDGNQQANNKIFDKILTSPAKRSKIQPSPIFENGVSEIEQPTEDPLHIEDANEDASTSTSKRKSKTTETPKTPGRKSLKTSKEDKKAISDVQPHEDRPQETENDTREKSPSSTSKRKKSAKRKATKGKSVTKTPEDEKSSSEAESNHDKMSVSEIYTDENDTPKSSPGKSTARKTPSESSEEFTDSTTFDKINRRSSSRLASKKREPKEYDSENDENLEMEAAELAKNVAAARKKDVLPKEVLEKLNNLVVRLRHEVLPQHQIENRAGSAALSYEQQKIFLSYAPLNKGKYSPAEDAIIMENWNDFCEDHDWDPEDYKPFILLKHGRQLIMSSLAERRKFVQFLANGLPYRPLCSVYSRFRLIYNKYEAMGLKYTQEEDAKIIAYMKCVSVDSQDQRCAELAKVMNRSRISIWKRYKKLMSNKRPVYQTKRVLTRVEWDLPLIEEFLSTLLSVTLSDELIELKGAFLPRVVWLKMEEKMQINWDIMQRFWEHKLHLQLFAPGPILMNEIRIKLIEYMHINKIRHSKEIKWSKVVKYFDGYTKPFLRYAFNVLTLQTAEALKTRDFNEILEWLHTRRVTELRYKMWDKNLPRITYKDKKAELVDDDLARVRIKTEDSHVD